MSRSFGVRHVIRLIDYRSEVRKWHILLFCVDAVAELLIMFERDIKLKAYAHGCCIQLLYHPVHLAQRRHFKIKVPFQVDAYWRDIDKRWAIIKVEAMAARSIDLMIVCLLV